MIHRLQFNGYKAVCQIYTVFAEIFCFFLLFHQVLLVSDEEASVSHVELLYWVM